MSQTAPERENKFPFHEATFVSAVKRLLVAREQTDAAEVLAGNSVAIVFDQYDSDCKYWILNISVSIEQWAEMGYRENIEQCVTDAARDMMRSHRGPHCIGGTSIVPAMPTLVALENINNQGGVPSAEPPHVKHDGLKFRSHAEKRLCKALQKEKVTFAPLPVFVNGSVRREPDFFIVKDGYMMLVEVDGPDTHPESPVVAERRLAPFKDEGVRVERISTAECENDTDAEKCAKRLVAKFDRYRNQR